MKSLKIIFCVGFLLICQVLAAQEIEQYLSDIYKNHVIPGFSAVVVKGDKIIFSKGYGVEVNEKEVPMTSNTSTAIGSLTKSITALAVLQLVEQGKIRLDDPVINYLPWFRAANKDVSDLITVRMLLNNTSSIPSGVSTSKSGDLSDKSIERLVRSFKSIYLTKKPGNSYEYSNGAFCVAGLIVSKVSGMPYTRYIERHIFKPLKMSRTTTDAMQFGDLNVLYGHHGGAEEGIPAQKEQPSGEYIPAGSLLRSSTKDLGNYLIALLNGGRFQEEEIITQESIKKMWSPQIAFPGLLEEDGGDGSDFFYGLGWMITEINGKRYIHHGGSIGTMSSMTILCPEDKTAFSILMNIDMTFIDKYRFENEFHIAYNVLRLASGQTLSDYGIPRKEDPTFNSYDLHANKMEKYTGDYLFSSGSNHWFSGARLTVFKNAESKLECKIFRGRSMLSHFILDFINEGRAVSRNIHLAEPVQFTLKPNGSITEMMLFGMRFSKLNETFLSKYQEVISKDKQVRFFFPTSWEKEWVTNHQFKANKANSTIEINFSPNPNWELEDIIYEKTTDRKILHEGILQTETFGQILWKEKTFITQNGEKQYQHLVLDANGIHSCQIILTTPKGKLTGIAQESLIFMLNSLQM